MKFNYHPPGANYPLWRPVNPRGVIDYYTGQPYRFLLITRRLAVYSLSTT